MGLYRLQDRSCEKGVLGRFSGLRGRLILQTVRAAATAVLASLALTGCTAAEPPPAPSGLPDGVTVAVTQQRSDVAERQAEVQIHNGTDGPLRIGAVSLDDPRFAAPATRVVERTSTLAPGATVNVRVQLQEAVCDTPDEATPTATIAYEAGDVTGTGTASAPEVFPFLAALHRDDCVAQAVDEVAEVSFTGFTPSDAGAPASLELTIAPRPGAPGSVVIDDIRETNLVTFVGLESGALALDVEVNGTATETVDLPLLPSRCDPHAVQEDKRGTVFTLDVTVDGAPGTLVLASSPELRAEILRWVTSWCGYG